MVELRAATARRRRLREKHRFMHVAVDILFDHLDLVDPDHDADVGPDQVERPPDYGR